jgi:hypothetical protein
VTGVQISFRLFKIKNGGNMVFGNIFGKKKDNKDKKKEEKVNQIDLSKAKYPNETCALCNQIGCDKKWGGQYWHKKCLRNAKGMAKGMI